MSIFSDFQDNVITPVLADYKAYNDAKPVALQTATAATPTGAISTTGIANKNPTIFGMPQNTLIIVAVVAIIAFFVLRK